MRDIITLYSIFSGLLTCVRREENVRLMITKKVLFALPTRGPLAKDL